jgi:hypothetical protein
MERIAFMNKRLAVLLVLLSTLFVTLGHADKKKESSGSADLTFTVVRDVNGKPVRNASVILHPVNENGNQERGGFQLKTDASGKTSFAGVPYGKLRVQVIATGLQTFGEDYDISKPQHDIVIKLKPPQRQYSIYEDHPEQAKPQQTQPPK